MNKLSTLDWITFVLVAVGGINWGLVGAFNFDLVMTIFGSTLAAIIYVLVGLSALYWLLMAGKLMKK